MISKSAAIILIFFILLLAGLWSFLKKDDKKNSQNNLESKEILSVATTTLPAEQPVKNIDASSKKSLKPLTKKETLIPPLAKTEINLPNIIPAISAITSTSSLETPPLLPKLPPLDEESLLKAVVKIQCPADDGLSKYVGSGFVLKGGVVATAAHVIKDSASSECEVIFSHERRPIYYLRGKIENLKEVIRRHDTEGIDFAVLKLPDINSYSDAKSIFLEYPYISYPVCENPAMLGDELLHFGYPSNYADQNYLSEQSGGAVVYADIGGIKEALSEDQTFTYKTPIFSSSYDESRMHPYMVSRVASFYGDSGGLAFNETKQCILGPHRGGTIGKTTGENYSVFMLMGWGKVRSLY